MAARAISKYSKLSGVFFRQFRRGETLITNHWLDTNRDKHYEIMNRIVIPDCMKVASEVPGYPERIQKLLSYNIPAFRDAWSFCVELLYRTVADPAHQTDVNVTKMYILRAIMDMSFSSLALLDDCTDGCEHRLGKKSWHTICEGGVDAAVYDGAVMAMLPFHVLKLHFKNDPAYIKLFEAESMCTLEWMIGQTLDILGQKTVIPSLADYNHCYNYKAGKVLSLGVNFGLFHAGVFSEEIVRRTNDIFNIAGKLYQVWDDFNDYFSTIEQTGKPSSDIQNGSTTWVSSTAVKNFTKSQALEFKACYGSDNPAKIERVKKLYEDIDMPTLYVKYMIENYNISKELIKDIGHPKVQEACNSFMEWLVGQNTPDY